METNIVTLSRELRFGLHEQTDTGHPGAISANGFAGNPALLGMGVFLILRLEVRGKVNPATGMLVNIKEIDRALRDRAVPRVREYFSSGLHHGVIRGAGDLVIGLLALLGDRFDSGEVQALELGLSPFLRVAANSKEVGVAYLTQRFEFSAAHRLHSDALSEAENQKVFGKCNNLHGHGHNYELEVTLAGTPDEKSGAVFPVEELQEIVNHRVVDVFDHKHLNMDCPEFKNMNPTVENIAQVIFGKLTGQFGATTLKKVRVWETPKTWCEYEGNAGN